jgi:hypothetical protein
MTHKTLRVIYIDGAWKILEENRMVGSYAARAMAARRAMQKAEAASNRGESVLVLLHNRRNELESTRSLPHARKPRVKSEAAEGAAAAIAAAPRSAS